ncbi:anti-sigma regulatory factor (Ser/Thr protein kinase) [Lentzea atacamensis]|uniref:Anti-sigma regulatory factor (Ser/Thr protein kinase) n=1 Tax=Lentzea atacamensis TaxID=531938 RepID=A0A316I8G2_9PSEU|nr:anti-sigma factor RsbA family regulatory protein [Lentzea atacamensis]PWK83559.1 anti-sigma regulatory factor (Ser/Thr protein kinase) [Lentzea atacamensis]
MTTIESDAWTVPPAGPFVHPALFYVSDDEYLAVLVPFIAEGVASDQPVAVAVPAARLELLRSAAGDAADRVTWVDMTQAGRNPGRIIPLVLRRFADAHPDRHARIVGEPIWPGRTATEYPACVQHEALINHAFAGSDVTILCPYDTVGLEDHVVADARATHPVVWEPYRRYSSDLYAPDEVVARYNQPLPEQPDVDELPVTEPTQLSAVRRWAAERARRHGLEADRIADLEYIATELVTNSLVHTPGGCRLRLWRHENHVVCEVRDTGQLADPLAGRRPRPAGLRGGRGVLLVNQFADLVRVHATPHGTTIYALLRPAAGTTSGD